MKKYLLGILLCCSIEIYAQFYSSENVYCYQYEYTSNDGIKSKKSTTDYYFVNFQNDMMGYVAESDIEFLRRRLVENPTHYEDRARNDLAYNYSKWKSAPTGQPTIGPATAQAVIVKYCSQYSTGSKYTYRCARKYARHSGNPFDVYGQGNYWGKESWGSKCFSFSRDRSEMIIWSTDDPENRQYYKLVDASKLKPNTDFLY